MAAFYLWLRRHPRLVDGVLAAALGIPALASAVAAGRYALVAVCLALVIPLVFRRDHPVAAFAIGTTVGALQVLFNIHVNMIDAAIVVLLYTLAAYCRRRLSVAGLAICLIGSAAAVARWAPADLALTHWIAAGLVVFAGSSLIAWVLGDSMRYRRGYYASLEDRAARLERERDAQAQIAAAAERARIARELHDVIAHNVSVMVVQADGASYAIDSSPERARQALGAISSTGRQALAEMRRLLGVLRSDDGPPGVVPLPGIGQLGELLEQTRASGLAVSFTVQGVPGPLPGGLALAAYRIIQESLTNTRKHGGPRASAQVLLRYCEDVLVLQITDDGRGVTVADDAGHGLTGMRERVALYNGTLHAGPLPGGGFQVTATLPFPRAGGQPGRADSGGSGGPGPGRARTGARRVTTINILLVDDQELVRTGFRMVLDAQEDMCVVGEAGDGLAATRMLQSRPTDVVVMDVRMPRLDGIEATRQICAAGDRPRVLMLTTFDLDEYAYAALKAGASGFLLKDVPPEELLFAIRAVHSGDAVVAPSTTRRLIDRFAPLFPAHNSPAPPGLGMLTSREREVLAHVAQGLSNAEIGQRLFVSEATVKTHVGRVLAKLGLRDRVQAVVFAYETGLVRAGGTA